MKNIKLILLFAFCFFLKTGIINAHALYIDVDKAGKTGKTHEVRVYYSEFEDRTNENISDWYSDVANFKLWLVGADGERVELSTVNKENHFYASFTPETKGIYRLEIGHTAEDPADGTAYQFNAFAQVYVGNEGEILPVTNESPDLVLIENSEKKDTISKTFKTYFNGIPVSDMKVTVFYPSGKKEEMKSDSEGTIEFGATEKGDYFLEATTYNEKEPGETNRSSYKSVWRVATYKIYKE